MNDRLINIVADFDNRSLLNFLKGIAYIKYYRHNIVINKLGFFFFFFNKILF